MRIGVQKIALVELHGLRSWYLYYLTLMALLILRLELREMQGSYT